jgi:hypothetical protein
MDPGLISFTYIQIELGVPFGQNPTDSVNDSRTDFRWESISITKKKTNSARVPLAFPSPYFFPASKSSILFKRTISLIKILTEKDGLLSRCTPWTRSFSHDKLIPIFLIRATIT